MKARIHTLFVLLGPMALGACGQTNAMSDGQSTMQSALTDATAENSRHLSACQTVDSLPSMVGELDRYETNMTPLIERVDGAHGKMSHCSGGNLDGISQSIAGMHTEMSDDEQRMRNAPTLTVARSECSTHVNAMNAMMQGMMGDLNGMSCMMMGN